MTQAPGRVEVHVVSAASNYQQFTNHVATVKQSHPASYYRPYTLADYDGDGIPDLVGVNGDWGPGTVCQIGQ